MAAGIVKEINSTNRSYYMVNDISFCFSETRGIYNFKSWVNKSEIRWVFGETPTFDEFKQASEKIFIEQEFCTKPMSPYDRTSSKVYATGNKWAKENFDATHN